MSNDSKDDNSKQVPKEILDIYNMGQRRGGADTAAFYSDSWIYLETATYVVILVGCKYFTVPLEKMVLWVGLARLLVMAWFSFLAWVMRKSTQA